MSSDSAIKLFDAICAEVAQNMNSIQTEEDAKIQIILRIVLEVLGWKHSDIGSERKHDNGYSDFIISNGDTPAFVLEAKRTHDLSIKTAETGKLRHLKLSGNALKEAQEGIEQAASYAAPNGIQVAVLSNGIRWIIFKSFTAGASYKLQEAFVFPSLESISADFLIFYELLSKDCFAKKLYNFHFDRLQNKRAFHSIPLLAPLSESEIRIIRKSDLAFDLEQVFIAYFSRLSGEQDDDMLIECFVETKESRIADLALEKVTANVLGNISPREKDVDIALSALIESAVDLETGQTVFIVGPTGSGKTTFLQRFFRKTLSATVRSRCVVVRVNCLDSTGRQDTALQWFTETLIRNIEHELYTDGTPTWDELQGLYYVDYERRRKGVDAHLYERDKQAFKEKFGEYLDGKVENDREGYLRRILADVVNNRKKLPIIIVDNTDEFTPEFKRDIFQCSQALRREANHCMVVFPVTDKSAWAFSKTDLYGIYRSKSFFLPTPPPREVFRRRIDYIRDKIQKLATPDRQKEYLVGKGIRLSIESMVGFAAVLEEIFVDHDYTAKTIGELSNYNIRRTLELCHRVMTSSVLKVEELVKAFLLGKRITLDYQKFMNALMRGDYQYFKQSDNHNIFPIFQVDGQIRQSPLLNVRILMLLDEMRLASRDVESRHLSVQSIIDFFDAMGASEVGLDGAISRLKHAGLVEAYDPSVQELSGDQRLAISHSGIRHLRLALGNVVFFEQMALTTGIVTHDIVQIIRGKYRGEGGEGRYVDRMAEVRAVFADYLIEEDGRHLHMPSQMPQYERQRDIEDSILGIAGRSSTQKSEIVIEGSGPEPALEGAICTVGWFNYDRGYGFVDMEGREDQAFLHVEILREGNIDRVFDGDRILCDVARKPKGLFVSRVTDVEEDRENIEVVDARVIRIFADRGYGFVTIGDGSRDAIFYLSFLDQGLAQRLQVGTRLRVEISPYKNGEGFQVRKIVAEEITPEEQKADGE